MYNIIFLALSVFLAIGTDTTNTRQTLQKNLIHLTTDNFVIIRGQIGGLTSAKVIHELSSKFGYDELYLYLVTPGGSVSHGMDIVQLVSALVNNGVDVKCIADTALSMGFVIFQYCPVRYVLENSILMQHQMSLKVGGPIKNIDTYMSFVKSMGDDIDKHQADRIGKTYAEFSELVAHDWWIFGRNNVLNNTADELVNAMCNFRPSSTEDIVPTIFGDVYVTWSTCPLVPAPLRVGFGNASISKTDKDTVINQLDIRKYVLENPVHYLIFNI